MRLGTHGGGLDSPVHVPGIDDVINPQTGKMERVRLLSGVDTIWLKEQKDVTPEYARNNLRSLSFLRGTKILRIPEWDTTALEAIAESRKDCIVFISPQRSDVVDNSGSETTALQTFRQTTLSSLSSSYMVCDSAWKYQFDKYNDVYRYVPLNGDIAGLCARTDLQREIRLLYTNASH